MTDKARRKGIGLIIVIIIMLLAALALAGMAAYIQNASALTSVRIMRQQALSAAMYGLALDIDPSIKEYYYGKCRNISIPGCSNLRYDIVTDRDLVRINASGPCISFSGGYWQVSNVYLLGPLPGKYSTVDTLSVAINKIKVEWYETGNINSLKCIQWVEKNAQGIVLSTTSQIGTYSSGQEVALNPSIVLQNNYMFLALSFQDRIPPTAIVIVTFYFDSPPPNERRTVIFDRGYSGNDESSVTSTGIVDGKYKRTLVATIDREAGAYTSFQEIDEHI